MTRRKGALARVAKQGGAAARSAKRGRPAKQAARRRGSAANDRQLLARITEELIALKGRVGQSLYEMGVRLVRVRDAELWRAGRFETFDDYAENAVGISRTSVYKLMRVAREFNAKIAARYGVEKLELGLRYLDHTPEDERPGDVLAADLRVRDESGRYTVVPFHEASVRDILDAINVLRENQMAAQRASADLRKRAKRLEQALPESPSGLARGSRVRLRRARDGRVAVTFSAIPMDELESFLEAVRKHLVSA